MERDKFYSDKKQPFTVVKFALAPRAKGLLPFYCTLWSILKVYNAIAGCREPYGAEIVYGRSTKGAAIFLGELVDGLSKTHESDNCKTQPPASIG